MRIGKWTALLALLVTIPTLLACAKKPMGPDSVDSALSSLERQGVVDPVSANNPVHWGYEEENGPETWCSLDQVFAACCDRPDGAQTPINLTHKVSKFAHLPRLNFQYGRTELEVENNGHTIEAKVPAGEGSLGIGSDTYQLVQFHWHGGSEHTINGRMLPLEMHLVHKADNGALAVVGVFIVQGRKNWELEKIFASLPQEEGAEVAVSNFQLRNLLPKSLKSWRYSGSLTTPPCSEAVRWNVIAEPIEMSGRQIQKFVSLFSGEEFPHGNRRPIQPLNGREVLTDLRPHGHHHGHVAETVAQEND